MSSKKDHLEEVLREFIPPATTSYIADFIINYRVSFRISKSRKSKLGDYRPPFQGKGHRISVNHNLNPYQFLITTVHELAHLTTWEKYKNKVKSHGKEWQNEFSLLMRPIMNEDVFPDKILHTLKKSMQRPSASSCSDPQLSLVLQEYDEDDGMEFVKDLPHNSYFELQGKLFKKGPLVRTRFQCIAMHNKRTYLVNGLSRAKKMNH